MFEIKNCGGMLILPRMLIFYLSIFHNTFPLER